MLNMLRNRRLDAGMTQAELARKMGVSRMLIGRCERGDRRIDVIEFVAFCRALNIELETIIRELDQRQRR